MEDKNFSEMPQILLLDCPDDVVKELTERNYNIRNASFGKDVKVDFNGEKEIYVPLVSNFPSDSHEFEVFVMDMCGVNNAIELSDIPANNKSQYIYQVRYPNELFYTSTITSKMFLSDNKKPRKAIYLIFGGDFIFSSHTRFELKERIYSQESGTTYDFLSNICKYNIRIRNKVGKRTIILSEDELSRILYKYNDSFRYLVTFDHPSRFDVELEKSVEREDFLPLIVNDNNEIVSFICQSEDDIIIVLPQTDRKREIVVQLFEEYFPKLRPEFFPESTKFLWLSDQKFALPNTNAFEERKQAAQSEYEAKVKRIDEEIQENNKQFGYLHDLLKETDDLLVKAVIAWFEWLGFKNVIDVDQEKGTKQEDINIIEDDYVIIAEVKGIGGTSTDSECSQINKHRRRHEKENRGKEIHPIYIVNHQRFISPELRSNPPFTKDQIDYAVNDERGLVTTYQLFTWYKLVSDGLFSKGEISEVLRQLGSIPLIPPNYKLLGTIKVYLPKPRAFIIDLANVEIKVGDRLLFVKELDFQKAEIQSIQDNGTPVEGISNGEAGVVVDAIIGKGYSVYLCPKTR